MSAEPAHTYEGFNRREFVTRVSSVVALASLPVVGTAFAAAPDQDWSSDHDRVAGGILDALVDIYPPAQTTTGRADAKRAIIAAYKQGDQSLRANIAELLRGVASGRSRTTYSDDASQFAARSRGDKRRLLQQRLLDSGGEIAGPSPEQPIIGGWSPAVLTSLAFGLAVGALPGSQRFDSDEIVVNLKAGRFT